MRPAVEAADLVGVLAVAAGAAAQAITGLGFSLVSAPFLVTVLGPVEGIRTTVLLSAVLNGFILAREHRGVLVREGSLVLVPALVAAPLLAIVVRGADPDAIALAAGILTVVSAGLLASGVRLEAARGRAGALAAGVVSAGMNVVAGIAGPAVAIYAVNAGWPPARMRPTLQAYFLLLNLVTLASLGLPDLAAVLLVGLAVGRVAGGVAARRVPEGAARAATLLVAAAGGVAAVVRALA